MKAKKICKKQKFIIFFAANLNQSKKKNFNDTFLNSLYFLVGLIPNMTLVT